MMAGRLGALGLMIIAGSAEAKEPKVPKQLAALMAMTPSEAQKLVVIKDDDLEVQATLTSEPVFRETRGLLKIVWNDSFLRAFVDKKTGEVTYQVYAFVRYSGSSWRSFNSATFETPSGPEAVVATKVGSDVDCSSTRLTGGCTYVESVVFPVQESLLQTVAAAYVPGQKAAWQFRLKGQGGTDFDDGLAAAEVAGLLAAVGDYRSARNLPK